MILTIPTETLLNVTGAAKMVMHPAAQLRTGPFYYALILHV